ncbi:hypothetical protein BDQ12DRAFT_502277 [Crucibulum laeve]|uniref:Uncharacterized protein n=1 Tax=Crucibulum laeve TaxID=68775 RepID=A0A5C3LII6_9AGAR|nr:hypothetical protein BDQ12DRAFT_502277 [Crucibulum laeve]
MEDDSDDKEASISRLIPFMLLFRAFYATLIPSEKEGRRLTPYTCFVCLHPGKHGHSQLSPTCLQVLCDTKAVNKRSRCNCS